MNQRTAFGRFSQGQHEFNDTSWGTFFGELAAKPAWLVGFCVLRAGGEAIAKNLFVWIGHLLPELISQTNFFLC